MKQNKNNVSFICNYNSPQGQCCKSKALAGKGLLCPKQHIIMNAVHKKKSITKKQGIRSACNVLLVKLIQLLKLS